MIPAAWSARRGRAELRRLRHELSLDLRRVAPLRCMQQRQEWLEELVDDLDRQLDRSESAAVVTLVGATGAGKSTLLNAIAGREIAREGVDRPTTSKATIHAPVDAVLDALMVPGAQVETYQPANDAEAYVLIDAPDMNSIAEEHAEVARALLQRSDVLLVVMHRQSIVEAAPVELLDEFARRRALAFVLNRADELTNEAREALLAQIATLARERWHVPEAPVIALSARRARLEPRGQDRSRLRELLASLVGSQAVARIRRHNALGTAAQLAEVAAEARNESHGDREALVRELAEALAQLGARVADESTERWQMRRTEMERRLRLEVARRWDGPVGWVLRLGGRDLLGMGAAGWIARRHPLVGAGAAVGAVAAAAVQDSVSEHSWRDSQVLLPAPMELAQLYRHVMAPVRIRLGRLYASDGGMPLPADDVVFAALADAIDTSWCRLVERDLPRAAEHSWVRYLRLLLDAPVYGLLAWVVYHAAVGFVQERYVGIDMLTNVALLGSVYLLIVRAAVARGLSWRARILLRAAVVDARSEVEAWSQGLETEATRQLTGQVQALERLADLPQRWQTTFEGTSRI